MKKGTMFRGGGGLVSSCLGLAMMVSAFGANAQIQPATLIDVNGGIVAGTDCSRSDVAIRATTLGSGITRLTIAFRALKASLGQRATADRASCIIRLPAEIAGGTRLSILSMKASGYISLNESTVANTAARVALFGVDSGVRTLKFDGQDLYFGELRYARDLLKVNGRIQPISGICNSRSTRGLLQFNAALTIQESNLGSLRGDPMFYQDMDIGSDSSIFEISNGDVGVSRIDVILKQDLCL